MLQPAPATPERLVPAIDPVILQLRADVRQYQNEIRATTTLVTNQLDRQERSILNLEHQVERSSGRIAGAFQAIGRGAAGFVSGFALGSVIRELSSLADEAKLLDAQLRLATAGSGSFGRAQADVQRIAEATRSSLSATATLYGNFQRNAAELGITQAQAARATETVAKTFRISGASAVDASQGVRQLVQGLQSGVLRGDEFNSIAENSPRLLRLLADSLGVTVGALRAMAEEGKLTSDALVRAFTDRRFTATIDAEFKQIPATFGDAMTAVENAALITFGEFDRGGRFSDAIVAFLGTGTDTFQGLGQKAQEFGAETRAVFDGLANLFDPILINGNSVFDALGVRIFSVREQIQSLLDSFDRFANFDANIENAVKRGFNRAIDRAGGGKHFEETPLSRAGAQFRAGTRISDARSRVDAAARRLEANGFIVPRNADGSVNEAGIVRRPQTARPSVVRTSSPSARAGAGRRVGAGRVRATAPATEEAATAADIFAAIAKDLERVNREASRLVLTDAEKLERSNRQARDIFGDQDPLEAGVEQYDRERDARLAAAADAERQAQDIREANVRQLAATFEDLFVGGTDEVWRNFKREGLRTLALILAQSAIQSFGAGGNGGGSFFGNVAAGLKSAFGGGGFGRASGGYVAPGQTVRVNEGRSAGVELLRMGPQGGTVIPLGQTRAVRPSGGTTVISAPRFDLKGAVITRELYADMERISAQSAAQARDQAVGIARKGFPSAQERYRSLGTTG